MGSRPWTIINYKLWILILNLYAPSRPAVPVEWECYFVEFMNQKIVFVVILLPENIVYSVKELQDEVPELYLSHKERYESSIRKACILQRLQNEYGKKHKVLK